MLETVPEVVAAPGVLTKLSGTLRAPGAVVAEILRDGTYQVRFGGNSIEATGPSGLKIGDRVRVTVLKTEGPAREGERFPAPRPDGTGSFTALLPLAFGGADAVIRLEAFVGKKQESRGKTRPVYFLVETETLSLGKTQWGVHLMGRRVALQVHVEDHPRPEEPWKSMSLEVENSLRMAGFEMDYPTQWVVKPLRIPEGYGLSVRG
jgi:hypothetical protein